MLLSKMVKTTWQRPTCTHYKNLGYKFTKIYDEFEIKVEDLPKGSHVKIECLCDYCLEEGKKTIVPKEYREYIKSREFINKDACSDCKIKKEKEVHKFLYGTEEILSLPSIREKIKQTNLEKYGCENVFQNEDIKEKIKQTFLNNYGVENYTQTKECQDKIMNTTRERYGVDRYSQSDECKEKVKNTNLNRYGFEYYAQTEEHKQRVVNTSLIKYGVTSYTKTDEYKERAKETNLKKWGVEFPTQSQIIKDKTIQTNLNKWGYPYPMQNPEYLETQKLRIVKGMKEKGTVNYSSQQEHICKLLNGKLNYLIDSVFLDIAIPEDKIYIEYDGSGHNIQLRIGKVTEKEFRSKELKRYYFLKSLGWKQVEILSSRDYLPEDDIIIKSINDAINKLVNGHNWVKLDIDNGLLILKNDKILYDFGKLHKLN